MTPSSASAAAAAQTRPRTEVIRLIGMNTVYAAATRLRDGGGLTGGTTVTRGSHETVLTMRP
jgi:hypothetical protein